MRTQLALSAWLLAPLLAAAGCASGDAKDPPGAPPGNVAAAIASDPDGVRADSHSARYFTLRRALLPVTCPPAGCDSWWVHEVNHADAHEVFVGKLDFTESGLDSANIALVRTAPPQELVVFGRLVPQEGDGRALSVLTALRGMPDIAAASDESFFQVADSSGCEPESAHLLNHEDQEPFTTFSLTQVDHRVQTDWLVHRLRDHGAIARGAITAGDDDATPATGESHVLDATQVYLRLPERIGPCPAPPIRVCPSGTVGTFARTADRCFVFTGCVERRICPFLVPRCGAAYERVAWPAAPSGCLTSVCDPAWTSPVD